jgi:hypothetical protein
MSLSLKKLEVINVKDPHVIVNDKHDYVYLEGPYEISQKSYVTSSVSNSALQFTCPPPSMNNFTDPKIYFRAPIRLTFTRTSVAAGETILIPGMDAPRAYGLSSSISTVNATINTYSISNNVSDYVHPFMRYNTGPELRYGQQSVTPTYLDQSQLYSSLYGSIRNPLGAYGDGIDHQTPRGGYSQYKIASQTVIVGGVSQSQPSTAAGQLMTSIVDVVFTENFYMLSPFAWVEKEVHPFVHVSTIDFNITMLNTAARFWSRSETSLPLGSISYTFASILPQGASPTYSFEDTQPSIQFTYYTPKESQMIPQDLISCYPYFDIQRFPTDISAAIGTGRQTMVTNNIQLSSIPNKIYVFIRPRNNLLYSDCTMTDTYCAIDKLSIQYFNRTGILNSASRNQLYQISKKNGCNMSYEEWSGDSVYPCGQFTNAYNTVGSVICLSPALDFGLNSLQAGGKIDHNTLQIEITFRNLSTVITAYTMYVVVINEGVFTIAPGSTNAQVGVLTSEDILNAQSKPYINYENIKDITGGDFLSGLKSFFTDTIAPILRKSKIGSTLSNFIPVVGPAISKTLKNLGYGNMNMRDGGVLVSDRGGTYSAGGRMLRKGRM